MRRAGETMTPRPTVALLFAVLGVAVLAETAIALWIVVGSAGYADDVATKAMMVGGLAAVALGGTIAIAWTFIELRLVRPLASLKRSVEMAARVDADVALEMPEANLLGDLDRAVAELIAAMRVARHEQDAAIGEATERAEATMGRLAAILNLLDDGVLVCTLDHRILLYNHAVLHILGRHEAVGLARSLFAVIAEQPVIDTLDRLRGRAPENGRGEPLVCATSDAQATLSGRMNLTRDADGAANGYILTFAEADEAATIEERHAPSAGPLPARTEFFDFDLLAQAGATGPLSARPLHSLVYVVFDTETTGLRPSAGDEIVSIAGVRIVNRRVITGETFHRLVDPERPISETSTRFHGITDDMVGGCPPARVVLPRFEAFVEDAVLVAHNAAFDMKFLAMKQDTAGTAFDNPVLDTLLLSAYLHDHATAHHLDAVAARFGVEVSGRHDALGDSMVTAAIFLHMIDLLEQRGVRTLGDALEAQDSMVELRKRQAQF